MGHRTLYPIVGLLLCLFGTARGVQTVEERISHRDFPSVFQAWSPADNLPREGPTDTLVRHDLVWQGASFFKLTWSSHPEGLAESFTPAGVAAGQAYRRELLSRNPNMILLLEIRYRDAWDDGVVTRAFRHGMVAYNVKGNGPVTLSFAGPMESVATGEVAIQHSLGDEDGDIYVPAGRATPGEVGSVAPVDVPCPAR